MQASDKAKTTFSVNLTLKKYEDDVDVRAFEKELRDSSSALR